MQYNQHCIVLLKTQVYPEEVPSTFQKFVAQAENNRSAFSRPTYCSMSQNASTITAATHNILIVSTLDVPLVHIALELPFNMVQSLAPFFSDGIIFNRSIYYDATSLISVKLRFFSASTLHYSCPLALYRTWCDQLGERCSQNLARLPHMDC